LKLQHLADQAKFAIVEHKFTRIGNCLILLHLAVLTFLLSKIRLIDFNHRYR